MVHILGKLSRRCGLVIGATALCFTFAALPPQAQVQLADEPRYVPSGDLLLPDGFETWVFVGSNPGLSYTPDAAAVASAPPPRAPRQQFHNVLRIGCRDFVGAGGLVSYGASLTDLYRRAADYVDKILMGAKPRDLPIEPGGDLELVVNAKTASALGIAIPAIMASRAFVVE